MTTISITQKKQNIVHYITWTFIVIIYSPIFYELYKSKWESIDYTHAYFILPVSLWAVWQKSETLKKIFAKVEHNLFSDIMGLGAVITGLLMFVFGWREDYLFISTLSFIPVTWGIIRYVYGPAVLKALTFPIFYLFFMIPPPLGVLDKVTMPMRYGVLQACEMILRIGGYPIERSGLLLTLDGNEIFMGAPCSGFRSLITMFALSVAYVYFVKGSFLKKGIMISAVIPFALFGNLIRVLTLCLLTYYAGQEVAEGFFHYGSGAVIFLVMIISLMGLEHLIDKFERKQKN